MTAPVIVLIIIGALLMLYIGFMAIPAYCIYRQVFSRQPQSVPLTKRDLKGTRYEPFSEELIEAEKYALSLPFENVSIKSREGFDLTGRYIKNSSGRLIILVHGYRGRAVSNFAAQIRDLYREGFSLLLITQRCHGESGGKRLGLGVLERHDIINWIDFADKTLKAEKIAVYGSSMGASAVGYAGKDINNPKVKALVIDCGFCSPRRQLSHDAGKRKLPAFMLLPLIRLYAYLCFGEDIYSTVPDALRENRIPALFIHGTSDETVLIQQGRDNYAACASEKEWLEVPGAPHILAYVKGGEMTKSKLSAFLNRAFDNK